MEREDAAHLQHACVQLCGLCKCVKSQSNKVGYKRRQVFISWILQWHQGVLVHLLADKENHQKSAHGVF